MASHAATLQQWAQQGKLSSVQLSADGSTLSLDGAELPGAEKITVEHDGKSCEYSIAAIFLQILDPDQSLIKYRQKAKTHQIKEIVKAIDKPIVVGFFWSSVAASADGAKPPVAEEAVATAADDSKDDRNKKDDDGEVGEKEGRKVDKDRKKDRHDKHRGRDKHRDRSSSSHKRERSSSRDPSATLKEKRSKEAKLDPESMMNSLSAVAGRREIEPSKVGTDLAQQEVLRKALSTEGFADIAPDVLQEFKQITATTMAHEIPVGNSSSILKAAAGKDLSRVLKLYNDSINEKNSGRSSTGGSSRKETSMSSSSKNTQKKSWKQHLVGKKPIIILPKAMTTPLTITNGYEFFANSSFVPRNTMIAKLRATKTEPQTTFARQVNANLTGASGKVEYELMDNPKSKLLRKEDWDRVVAVVALGQRWQFKDWPAPYFNDPVQLFGRTFGFYVGFDGDKVPDELQGWSVLQTKLSRDSRGLDRVTYATFWNALDEWMAIHKPEMLPQASM